MSTDTLEHNPALSLRLAARMIHRSRGRAGDEDCREHRPSAAVQIRTVSSRRRELRPRPFSKGLGGRALATRRL